jgi:hypothetical protein
MYDARKRNRFRRAATAMTGVAAVLSATATGVVTGVVARAAEVDDGQPDTTAAPQGEQGEPRRVEGVVKWKERPRRTVVHTRTVYVGSGSGSTSVGGGSVAPVSSSGSTWSGSTGSGSSGGGSGSSGGGGSSSGPGPGGSVAPPAPAPPPAPSSGS